MTIPRQPDPAEVTLLALLPGQPFPADGTLVVGDVLSGTGSARAWTDRFNPIFGRIGVTFQPGSLNHCVTPLTWPSPWRVDIDSTNWEFCQLILQDRVGGIAFRANNQRPTLLEIASPVHIRTVLGLQDGHQLSLRLLGGIPLW